MSISTPKVKLVSSGPLWAATALLAAVLAVPAAAMAKDDADAVAAGHAQRTPTELAQRDHFIATPGDPTPVSHPPAGTSDGFDWTSAAVGAGVSMGLVALIGVALLAVRRRSATSASASAS